MAEKIHFLFVQKLDGYFFNPPRPNGLSFSDLESGVEFQIRGLGCENDFRFGHENLEIRAKVSYGATQRQVSVIDTLLNEGIVKPSETVNALPYFLNEKVVVSSEGKIAEGFSPTADFLPEDLHDLCITVGEMLAEKTVRFVQLVRWLVKASGPVRISNDRDHRFSLYWKTTQEQYRLVPWPKQEPITLKGMGYGGLTWSESDQEAFGRLWEGYEEPLGHQLLREAKAIVEDNSKSALLIGYSALEVGIKQHISKCAPDAAWLAMYAPTPPLFKILKDYLKEIHRNNPQFENWSAINSELKLVGSFVEDRNKLAHRGENFSGSINEYIRITEDLLFAFDVFEGHDWAKARVSARFGKLLGWV